MAKKKKKSAMGKCMSEWNDKHPEGRGDVDDPHKQAVAVCLSKTGKGVKEGLTFKEYLQGLDDDSTGLV